MYQDGIDNSMRLAMKALRSIDDYTGWQDKFMSLNEIQNIDLGLSRISEASNIGLVNPAWDAMPKVDLVLATFGSDYASEAVGFTRGFDVSDFSTLDHLDETKHFVENPKKKSVPEYRLFKPNHSIRDDLLLSITSHEASISRKYIYETLKLLPLCNDAAKIAKGRRYLSLQIGQLMLS